MIKVESKKERTVKMKLVKFGKRMLVTTLFATLAFGVQADAETVNGIEWNYSVSDGKATITRGENWQPAIPETTSGTITIPSTLGGCAVVSIGREAFMACTSLEGVIIPNGVTNIAEDAFCACESLTLVEIPESVIEIGDYAFGDCSSLVSVTLPDSVKNLRTGAFQDCTKLQNVTMSDTVILDGEVFYNTPFWRPIATEMYKMAKNSIANGSVAADGRYSLSSTPGDRSIASLEVSEDTKIDSFVLKDGKVFDAVLYVNNTSDSAVKLTLPEGYVYKALKGAKPLIIPAASCNILSITRVADKVFLIAREELETVQ